MKVSPKECIQYNILLVKGTTKYLISYCLSVCYSIYLATGPQELCPKRIANVTQHYSCLKEMNKIVCLFFFDKGLSFRVRGTTIIIT